MRPPFTEYRPSHSAAGVLAEALAALPGYTDASADIVTATARCGDYLRTVPVSNDAAAAVHVLGLLDAGEPLPSSLPVDVWQAVHGREAVAALEATFQQALRSARQLHEAQQPLRDRENAGSLGEAW